jgi:hypothetical protein
MKASGSVIPSRKGWERENFMAMMVDILHGMGDLSFKSSMEK